MQHVKGITKRQIQTEQFQNVLLQFLTFLSGTPPLSLQVITCIELPKPGNSTLGVMVKYKLTAMGASGNSLVSSISSNVLTGGMQSAFQTIYPSISIYLAPTVVDFSPSATPTFYPSVIPTVGKLSLTWEETLDLVVRSDWSTIYVGNWMFIALMFTVIFVITLFMCITLRHLINLSYVKDKNIEINIGIEGNHSEYNTHSNREISFIPLPSPQNVYKQPYRTLRNDDIRQVQVSESGDYIPMDEYSEYYYDNDESDEYEVIDFAAESDGSTLYSEAHVVVDIIPRASVDEFNWQTLIGLEDNIELGNPDHESNEDKLSDTSWNQDQNERRDDQSDTPRIIYQSSDSFLSNQPYTYETITL